MTPRSWIGPAARLGRVAAFALVSVIGWAGLGAVAGAHAALVGTSPLPDQVLSSPPSEVRLVFSEAVDAGIGGIEVLDPEGKRVDIGTINRSADGNTLVVPIDPAPFGTHSVAWRVVSSDGHSIDGSFVFHIGRRSGGAQLADRSDPVAGAVEWVGRVASLGGLILLLGSLWMGGPRGLDRLARVERGAAVAVVAGSVLSLWSRGADAGGKSLWRSFGSVQRLVTDTWAGKVEASRVVLALIALVLVWRGMRLMVMGVAFAVMTTFPLAGHAWGTDPVGIAVMVDATHLGAVSVWGGGVVALSLALRGPDVEGAWAAGMVRQASRGFLVAAPVVVVTGVVSTTLHIGGLADLPATGWGRAVLVKAALAVTALGLGWFHRRRLADLVASGVGRLVSLRSESALLAVTIGVTAALVTMAPADVALDRPYSAQHRTSAGIVQLDVSPARGGVNDVHLAFRRDANTDRAVDAVLVRISSEGVPRRTIPVQLDGASHAFAAGVSFGPPGTWRVDVTTVYRGLQDTTTFEVELR